MSIEEKLRELLIDFFGLPPDIKNDEIAQSRLPAWDSLAMVQIIGELQSTFGVEFNVDEIQFLRSYDEIAACLRHKGAWRD